MSRKPIFIAVLLCLFSVSESVSAPPPAKKRGTSSMESTLKGKDCKAQANLASNLAQLSKTDPGEFQRLIKLAKKADLKCLRNQAPGNRLLAISFLQALGTMGSQNGGLSTDRVNRMKIKIAVKDKDLAVRKAALVQVSVPDIKSVKLIYKTLRKDPNEKIRELTAQALGKNTQDQQVSRLAAKALKAMLKDKSSKVVTVALSALSNLKATGEPAIAEAIKRLSSSSNRALKMAAIKALQPDAAQTGRLPAQVQPAATKLK